jgi:hypothetical protein
MIASDVVTMPKEHAEAGAGELRLGGRGAAGLDVALTEMLLLSRSLVLIRYPAGSFFTFYPAVMNVSSAGPVATIKDLQRPYEPDNVLSPAVLF